MSVLDLKAHSSVTIIRVSFVEGPSLNKCLEIMASSHPSAAGLWESLNQKAQPNQAQICAYPPIKM